MKTQDQKPVTRKVIVTLSEQQITLLDRIASNHISNRSHIIRQAIDAFLSKKEAK